MFLYLFVIILGIILSTIFGAIIMLPVALYLIITTINLIIMRKQYLKKHAKTQKSLSFAIKSMQQKKREFRFINKLFFLSDKQKNMLKKLSILVDGLFLKEPQITFENDYFGDPAYSISATNMFHDHDDDK